MKFGKTFFQVLKKMQGYFSYLSGENFLHIYLTFTIKSDYLKPQTRVLIYFLIIRKFPTQLLHD